MDRIKQNPIFWVILTIGVLCAGILLAQRIAVEQGDRHVAAGIAWSDVTLLAEESGEGADAWLERLSGAGVRYLILTAEEAGEESTMALCAEMEMELVWLGDPEDFPEVPAAMVIPGETDLSGRDGGEQSLALVENETRTGVVLPEKMLSGGAASLREAGWQPVKTLVLYDDYRSRWTEEERGSEIEALLFRAVTDRSQRFLWLRPFTDETGTVISDSSAYVEVLQTLERRLEERGYQFGEGFSSRLTGEPSRWLLGGAALCIAALAVLLAAMIFERLSRRGCTWLLLAGTAGCALLCLALPLALFQKLAALGAAVMVPCLSAAALARQSRGTEQHSLPSAIEYPLWMLGITAGSIAGGFLVGALLATEDYLLEFSIFSGVKVAELTPMVLMAVLLVWTVRRFPLPKSTGGRLGGRLVLAIGVVIVVLILALLLLRSGDGLVAVPDWEREIRDRLERLLYVRPRTKEFAGAWPALAAFLWAGQRRLRLLQMPFALLAVVGSVSVVNTFCHIYTPVELSLTRVLLGFAVGLVLGYVTLLVLTLADRLISRNPELPPEKTE